MYPLFLDLTGKLAVVVGGGPVGRRKADGVLAAGGRVRLVCLEPAPARPEGMEWVQEEFRPGHLEAAALAFAAATDECNAAVVAAAREKGILVCDASDGSRGDFHVPAVARTGPFVVAVGSGGRAPGVAAELRDFLAGCIGPEWAARAAAKGQRRGQG